MDDNDCDDDDLCTGDICNDNGVCEFPPILCLNLNFCDGVFVCVEGECESSGDRCLPHQKCRNKPPGCFDIVLFVNMNAEGEDDGTSWDDAFMDLRDALDEASSSSSDVKQIWVAQGMYTPAPPDGDQSDSFNLISGISIYGGFAGGETSLDDRDFMKNVTILSGDLNGDDPGLAIIDETLKPEHRGFDVKQDNSYHVVKGSGVDATAILDGFIIKGGNANEAGGTGGGMFINSGSPTITNCAFIYNFAIKGGGMYNDNSSPTLTNCIFGANSADSGGGMYNDNSSSPILSSCSFTINSANSCGGGMYNDNNSSPILTNCPFIANSANTVGGGMSNNNSFVDLQNCTFTENSAVDGGGMHSSGSSITALACTFKSNDACGEGGGEGGGIYQSGTSEIDSSYTNCIFDNNMASASKGESFSIGGGMVNDMTTVTYTNCLIINNSVDNGEGGGSYNIDSNVTMNNCTITGNSSGNGYTIYNVTANVLFMNNSILWGNIGKSIFDQPKSADSLVYFSDIQGGWEGEGSGNIDADPLFAGPDDLQLSSGSPCIDSGDSSRVAEDILVDLIGNLRIQGDAVDMGAYEFESQK